MLSAEATASGVEAVSPSRTTVAVDATDWCPADSGRSGPDVVAAGIDEDDAVAGSATELRFPPGVVTIGEGDWLVHLRDEEHYRFDETGPHTVRVDSTVAVEVTFSGEGRLDATAPAPRLVFEEPTAVSVAVAEREETPLGPVVVPKTPEGVATALSALPAGHLTATPDRSRPGLRGQPPRVAFGDETRIPESVERRRHDTEITVRVPPDLRYLFTAASLSHYLGATVDVDDVDQPRLVAPSVDYTLGSLPSFQYETAGLLRRVFFFDCLVRSKLPNNEEIAQSHLLDRLALDAERLASARPHERLATYLETPFDLVAPDLPDWHLSMYPAPTYDHVRTLPHVLQNLPNLFLPESRPLGGDERLTRSLDDFYRQSSPTDVSTVDPVKPLLGPGQTHGWLADGIPIDVFKSVPEAYENRQLGAAGGPASVAVVLNDSRMNDEHDHAADIYRRGTADLDIDVSVRSDLSAGALARVFEADHDLVHYIGHCEESGLRCADGHLATTSLSRSGAETFFLNACGSYFEGVELVRKGSVSGAVTFEKVLDSQAARVGIAFVRLLVNGFSIARALELARRRIIMGNDYAVVGDGTHRLSGATEGVPVAVTVTELDGADAYQVSFDSSSPRTTGGVYWPPSVVDDRAHLSGSQVTTVVDADEMDALLEALDTPVVFDGDIHWADDLRGSF